jgi:hypothetical protein
MKGTPFNMELFMKRHLAAAAGFALFAASGLADAASWSVFVEPGVYGRVVVGGYAEPPVVYAPQPVIAVDNGYGQIVEEVVDTAYATDQPPVYLWVPEYQRLHWAQYCREYSAVGVPVYFVDDGWYRANVMRRNWTPEQRSWSQQQWLEHDRLARDRYERQRFEQQRYEQQQRWNAQRAWYGRRQQQQQAGWSREQPEGQNRAAQGFVPAQANPAGRSQPGGGGYAGNAYAGNSGQPSLAASQPGGVLRGWQGGAGQNAGARRGEERGDREERRGPPERHGGFEHGRNGGRER